MFDLPVDTREARREYVAFRTRLLESGFTMLQYSVYARYCPNAEKAGVHQRRIRMALPPDGEVRVLTFTDAQYAHTMVYYGKTRRRVERAPTQIEMF